MRKNHRLWIVLAVLVLVTLLVRFSGLSGWFAPERIHRLVDRAGVWGGVAFVALFVGAVVAQVPGLPFVLLAPALFRMPEAFALCFIASNLAVMLNFALVRKLGGAAPKQVENVRVRKLFTHLDERPIRTVALIRVITLMFPPVTSALAFTPVKPREHAIGSAIGLVLPILGILLATRFVISS